MLFLLLHKVVGFLIPTEWLMLAVLSIYFILFYLLPSITKYLLAVAWIDLFYCSRIIMRQTLTLNLSDFPIIYDTRRNVEKVININTCLNKGINHGNSESNQPSQSDLGSIAKSEHSTIRESDSSSS